MVNKVEYLNKMKNLAKKVKEKQAIKKAKEEIYNEEEYEVFIVSQECHKINKENKEEERRKYLYQSNCEKAGKDGKKWTR